MMKLESPAKPTVIYPEDDGNPMSENTKQFYWITIIYCNLVSLFADVPNVFIAGDLLWYPVEGNNKIRQAPDVMVVFGAEKKHRGSYRQWEEGNIAPQVVFEILSPGNRLSAMSKKQEFYRIYGVEEYYLYDPENNDLTGWLRAEDNLCVIEEMNNWVSPRLGIRFDLSSEELQLYHPNGNLFYDPSETNQKLESALQEAEEVKQRAVLAQQQVEQEQQRAEQERQRAEQERQRAERLAERLRSLGLNPDEID